MGGQAAVFGAGWVSFGAICAWGPIVAERPNLRANSQCRVAERVFPAFSRVPIAHGGVCRTHAHFLCSCV